MPSRAFTVLFYPFTFKTSVESKEKKPKIKQKEINPLIWNFSEHINTNFILKIKPYRDILTLTSVLSNMAATSHR